MAEIANECGCSIHKIQYWMKKHRIQSRSISDASYIKHNPNGDPFLWSPPRSSEDHILYGLGMGLYWGEGTKSCLSGVRLGNTDPKLLLSFMKFLIRFFHVQKKDFRFGLQIFSDLNPKDALDYWTKMLRVSKSQFHPKVIVTRSGSLGTYRKKSLYGVVTVLYHNKKLRDALCARLPL